MFDGPDIEEGFLSPSGQTRLKAALNLLGTDQKQFAARHEHGYYRVSRMLNGREKVTTAYAESFNDLLERARNAQRCQAA